MTTCTYLWRKLHISQMKLKVIWAYILHLHTKEWRVWGKRLDSFKKTQGINFYPFLISHCGMRVWVFETTFNCRVLQRSNGLLCSFGWVWNHMKSDYWAMLSKAVLPFPQLCLIRYGCSLDSWSLWEKNCIFSSCKWLYHLIIPLQRVILGFFGSFFFSAFLRFNWQIKL